MHIVSDRKSVLAADAVVLPGVGAFGDCMANLEKIGLIEAIREFVASKRPFLGICLGFQALFEIQRGSAGELRASHFFRVPFRALPLMASRSHIWAGMNCVSSRTVVRF